MVLSRPDLLDEIAGGRLRFDPAIPASRVAQVSIDLRLGHKFSSFRSEIPRYIAGVHVDPSLWRSDELWLHETKESFRLMPGSFVLAHSLERVSIPAHLVGFVEGRSSFARVGITVHVTAPKIDPGFEGTITLEMANFGSVPVDLRSGIDEPAQLMLLRVSRPLHEGDLYGRGTSDIFQYQNAPLP